MKIIEFPALFVKNSDEVKKFQDMGIETSVEETPIRYCLIFTDGYMLELAEDTEDPNITNMYIDDCPYRVGMPYDAFRDYLVENGDDNK